MNHDHRARARAHGHGDRAVTEGQHHADEAGNTDVAGLLDLLVEGHQGDGNQANERRRENQRGYVLGQHGADAAKKAYQGKGAETCHALPRCFVSASPAPFKAHDCAQQQRDEQIDHRGVIAQ